MPTLERILEMAPWAPDNSRRDAIPLAAMVALVRAAAIVHQSGHWQAAGPTFYSDHLLFERLYDGLVPYVDTLAERVRVAGDRGPLMLSAVDLANLTAAIVQEMDTHREQAIQRGSAPEVARLALSVTATYDVLNACAKLLKLKRMSAGTEKILQDLADTAEQHLYLLQQRLDQPLDEARLRQPPGIRGVLG